MTGLILIMGLMEADNVLGRVVYFNELAGRGNISWSEWDSLLTMGASGGDTGAVVFALDKLVSKGKLSASARDSVMQEYSLLRSKTGDPASRVVFSDSVPAMTAQRLEYAIVMHP